MKVVLLKFVFFSVVFAVFGAASVFAQQQSDSLTPKEIILKSFKSLENLKSWTAEMIMTSDAAPEGSKIVLKVLAPNSSQAVWTYQGKVFSETITIGQDEYSYFEGKWEKKKKDKFEELWDNISKIVEYSEEKYMVNAAFAGKETLNGIETNVYQYEYDLKASMRDFQEKMQLKATLPERSDEMKAKVWINSEGLPLKFESVRKTEESKGKFAAFRKTVTYRFNEEVKIEAPKLVAGAKK